MERPLNTKDGENAQDAQMDEMHPSLSLDVTV